MQVALLSQRGRAMLRVCQQLASLRQQYNNPSAVFIARQILIQQFCLFVCPSVCLSVTFRYQMKTAQHIVIAFHRTVAQSFQFYQHQTSSRNSDGVTPCGGDKYRWGIKILRFSTNKWLYLANDKRQRHSYYGRRIGTRMLSIKWCYFQ